MISFERACPPSPTAARGDARAGTRDYFPKGRARDGSSPTGGQEEDTGQCRPKYGLFATAERRDEAGVQMVSKLPQNRENPVKAPHRALTGFSTRNATKLVDLRRIELLTSCMPCRRSPS